jgi:hypothetical protein
MDIQLVDEQVFKPTIDARRIETEKAYAAIVAQERRDRIEKTIRLRSLRLMRQ